MNSFAEYKKNKDFLVCVDSDGCAMDTMDIKHFNCFGPCMIDEWELSCWREEILNRWNEINLYTITRGINRFKGLALALSEINDKYFKIDGIDALVNWAENAQELSNNALKSIIESQPEDKIFSKALSWSMAVNKAIALLPGESKIPFPMVKEALEYAHKFTDIAIVSSANLDAVIEEWSQHSLLDHVDIVMSQNDGSKDFCVSELIKKGYAKNNIIMCGDAPGDLSAAEKNGIYFYPILVGSEKASWEEFILIGLNKLLGHTYEGEYQDSKKREFYKNLGE